MQSLQKQVSALDDVSIKPSVCEICLEGKMARKPFPHSEKRGKAPLDLIHTDLMGPARVPSFGGGSYAMTFIDDYSRKIFLYILTNKSQAFQKFQEFKAMVESQTGRKIKVLRSDNGREYVNHDLCTTCPAFIVLSRMEGLSAESPNWALMEMARCMPLDSGLDKRY